MLVILFLEKKTLSLSICSQTNLGAVFMCFLSDSLALYNIRSFENKITYFLFVGESNSKLHKDFKSFLVMYSKSLVDTFLWFNFHLQITYGDPTVRMSHLRRPIYNWKITLYNIGKFWPFHLTGVWGSIFSFSPFHKLFSCQKVRCFSMICIKFSRLS